MQSWCAPKGSAASIFDDGHLAKPLSCRSLLRNFLLSGVQDMDTTINEIIRVSAYPVSIIIVGVGPGPFGEMEQLDGDAIALKGRSGTVRAAEH